MPCIRTTATGDNPGGNGTFVVNGSSFTPSSVAVGKYTYRWQLPILGNITFQLVVRGVSVPPATSANSTGGVATVFVSRILQGFIDLPLSVSASHLQRDSEAVRQPLQMVASPGDGAIPVPVGAMNMLYLPVLRAKSTAANAALLENYLWFVRPGVQGLPDLSGFVRDPLLNATLTVSPLLSNGTVDTVLSAVYQGVWSSSNSSYTLGFRCPKAGLYLAYINLTHTGASAPQTVRLSQV